eukprot:TRINITY_DN11666_c0_g1_i2.p5 TRINITY_DN11666_c0_g1~~TRINITY_DN11666_c0_g1_i2.p5  ORF type:complete len:102 (+),score=4.11 TRINITY_DN11666_c0_g1_i2:3155-3460(+)
MTALADLSWLLRRTNDEESSGQLDLDYITDSIIACGRPWKNRTAKEANLNNESELASFLNHTHRSSYLIVNLDPDHTSNYNYSLFNSQVGLDVSIVMDWVF